MKLLILKTNIITYDKVRFVQALFDNNISILDWSVDIEDIDRVLRVEVIDSTSENDIQNMLKPFNITCIDLDLVKQDDRIRVYRR